MKSLIYIYCILLSFLYACSDLNYNYDIDTNYYDISKRLDDKDSSLTQNEIDTLILYLENENKDSLLEIISNKTALYYYDDNAELYINYIKKSASVVSKSNNKFKYANLIQNIAFVYDEKLTEYDEAINYCLKAIKIWQEINDTLNIANMQKYLGYLYGKVREFEKAKYSIIHSISLYESKKNEKGIAVSYFDFALVYYEEGLIDSALFYLKNAKHIWNKYDEKSRIFLINNHILRCYFEDKNNPEYIQCKNENNNILKSNSIYKKHIDDFHDILDE